MKKPFLVLLLLPALLLSLSGCFQEKICTSSEECAAFECDLECEHEKACVNGECECKCIEIERECGSDTDCEKLDCGIYPNKGICLEGQCKCEYECETERECKAFPCALECKPNYNYCKGGACSCKCETEAQRFSPWQVNELKEDLVGKIIVVEGRARIGEKECSEEECEGECCKPCSAQLELFSTEDERSGFIVLSGVFKGKEVKCYGNECEMDCWPISIENKYRVEGLWKKENTEYYLEPTGFELIERGEPRITPKKQEYSIGEEVKFNLYFGRSVFFVEWEKPKIQKKINGEWVEFNSVCGCVPSCEEAGGSCEDNIWECPIGDECEKASIENAWKWNQEYCILEEIDCEWLQAGVTDKVYCGKMVNAEPGTYRASFTYVEDCGKLHEKFTVFSNEFTIK